MNNSDSSAVVRVRERETDELALDNVLSTQPELGPTVPDGGYGWCVFVATLFFQALIPSLSVSFGMFLAFHKLPDLSSEDINPKLWDDGLMNTPLVFISSWCFFDPTARLLISRSTWPRLVGASGTCLTCAGLLFLWMGMVGYAGSSIFFLSGLLTGIGSSIQMAQCEILLGQYFKLRHTLLVYISQAVCAMGFVVAPIALGHNILSSNLFHVILWYQAILLQGLIANLTFKKPDYLKSKFRSKTYNYVTNNPDDEEDILSKNARELQIKKLTGSSVTIEKYEISQSNQEVASGSSSNPKQKDWEAFEDEEGESKTDNKYSILKSDWETFDEGDDDEIEHMDQKKNWEKFEDEDNNHPASTSLQTELAVADQRFNDGPTTSITGTPMPLFADLPVNNNSTYSYEIIEQPDIGSNRPGVFLPNSIDRTALLLYSWDLLRQPTFYKSLLTVITTKFSLYIYFTLFPTYLFQELADMHIRTVAAMMGVLSLSMVFFSLVAYWVNIDKKRRPICLWFLCWVGSFGYFMVSDANSREVLTFGAIQITVSMASMQYVGMPLLGLTLRGETNKEFGLISTLTGLSFIIFFLVNMTFKNCFRLMAFLHFFTGGVWFANYIYKKIMK